MSCAVVDSVACVRALQCSVVFMQELISQAAQILGSVDFLGNPMGLLNDVSEGMTELFKHGNVGGLIRSVTHGVSNSAAKVCISQVCFTVPLTFQVWLKSDQLYSPPKFREFCISVIFLYSLYTLVIRYECHLLIISFNFLFPGQNDCAASLMRLKKTRFGYTTSNLFRIFCKSTHDQKYT